MITRCLSLREVVQTYLNVTLADDNINSILADNANRAIQGNVAMHVMQTGDQFKLCHFSEFVQTSESNWSEKGLTSTVPSINTAMTSFSPIWWNKWAFQTAWMWTGWMHGFLQGLCELLLSRLQLDKYVLLSQILVFWVVLPRHLGLDSDFAPLLWTL